MGRNSGVTYKGLFKEAGDDGVAYKSLFNEEEHDSVTYKGLFNEAAEDDGVANLLQSLEHLRLEVWVLHDIVQQHQVVL